MFGRRAIHPVDVEMGPSSDEVLKKLQNVDFVTACNALDAHRKESVVLAKKNLLQAQARQKLQYDRKYVHFPNFQVGTQVLKKDFRCKRRLGGKLDFKWLGPYTIEANLGKGLFKLRSITNPQEIVSRVNGVHIKPYLQTTKVCMQSMHLH